jgi:hypothetical protein
LATPLLRMLHFRKIAFARHGLKKFLF